MLALSNKLHLPDEVASQTIAVLGIRGSGKTNTAGALVEELWKQQRQVVVIDPTDAHWGYRLTTAGKPSAFELFIFGGEHGDLPLREQDGKAIAEFLVEERPSVVLSLRHLRKAAQRRFVRELAEELYHLKGQSKYRTPMTLVIDEAPLFVPQTVLGEMAATVGAIEDLVARGRNAGFGIVLISQRAATLNKNVLTQAETIVCHRLPAPQDKKAIKEWFEENADVTKLHEVLASMSQLQDGEAWIWSPRLEIFQKTQIRLRATFDSSATPKPGSKPPASARLKEIDLDKLKGRMAAAVAEKQASDPTLLKKQVAELQGKLLKLESKSQNVVSGALHQKPLLSDVQLTKLVDGLQKQADKLQDTLTTAIERIVSPINTLRGTIEKHKPPAAILTIAPRLRSAIVAQPPATPRPRPVSGVTTNGDTLPAGEKALLSAVLQFENPTREELTVLSGYKRSSRDTYLQRLGARGYVVTEGDRIRATQEGVDALPDYTPLPTGADLRAYWLSRLPEGERKILQVVMAQGGTADAETISEDTGYKRSSRDTYLQRMSAKRIIVRDRGTITLHAMLR